MHQYNLMNAVITNIILEILICPQVLYYGFINIIISIDQNSLMDPTT